MQFGEGEHQPARAEGVPRKVRLPGGALYAQRREQPRQQVVHEVLPRAELNEHPRQIGADVAVNEVRARLIREGEG